jgi:hypothetical protein
MKEATQDSRPTFEVPTPPCTLGGLGQFVNMLDFQQQKIPIPFIDEILPQARKAYQ